VAAAANLRLSAADRRETERGRETERERERVREKERERKIECARKREGQRSGDTVRTGTSGLDLGAGDRPIGGPEVREAGPFPSWIARGTR